MPELSEESQRILDRAVATGRFDDQLAALDRAIQLLADELTRVSTPPSDDLTAEEWCQRFQEWADSHARLDYEADDSRESVYSGTIDDTR